MPKIKLMRTTWGVFDFTKVDEHLWEPTFKKLADMGYAGIEFPIGPFNPFYTNKQLALDLLKKYNLIVIGQIHTCSYPVSSRKVEDHVNSFRQLAQQAIEWGATFINSHSGSDSWTMEENCKFFEEALAIEKSLNIKIIHETHRQRVLYNPWITRDLIKKFPELKVNADLSHFCCVAERVFDDKLDDDWPEIIRLIGERCHLVHARVGYAEGPQVPDPSANEYSGALAAHERWWDIIWEAQARRGDEFSFVEPEFGPPPYLHTLPHTNVPVADLWEVNSWMGKRQVERFNQKYKN